VALDELVLDEALQGLLDGRGAGQVVASPVGCRQGRLPRLGGQRLQRDPLSARGSFDRLPRVPSPRAPALKWIFEQTAKGSTPGDIARRLNAQGIFTARGNGWRARAIHDVIDLDVYEGQRGYPAIIDSDLATRARANRTRLDPSAVQRRRGGRPAKDPAYLLRGIVFCTCGAPMYCNGRDYCNGQRAYICRDRIQGTGLCDKPPIPASTAEAHILRHLDWFLGDLDAWITERLSERSDEATGLQAQVDAKRDALAVLDASRDARLVELAEHGITSPLAFEIIERIDAERASRRLDIEDAEAHLSEWTAAPDADALIDFYTSIRDLVQGRVRQAKGAAELHTALADVLAGVWMELEAPEPHDHFPVLRADFQLRRQIGDGDVLLSMLPVGERLEFYGSADPTLELDGRRG
jgi:hypothetical protein